MSLPGMPCQELVEVITEYLEGTLPETDRIRLEAHLALCDPCVTYLEQMRETIAVLGRLSEDDLSEESKGELLILFRGWQS